MNKKGQLGKIITSPFILIFLVILMAIFIVIAIALAPGKSNSHIFSSGVLSQEELMTKNINVELKTGEKKDVLVIDALISFRNGDIEAKSLCNSLSELVPEKSGKVLFLFVSYEYGIPDLSCKIIAQKDFSEKKIFYDYANEIQALISEKGKISVNIEGERKEFATRVFSFVLNNLKSYVEYYYGEFEDEE